uniref:Uncharacterized protein n=1 Tax=Myripristis murdjan TaxID=586833 RepID=A0A667XZV1_9TELE
SSFLILCVCVCRTWLSLRGWASNDFCTAGTGENHCYSNINYSRRTFVNISSSCQLLSGHKACGEDRAMLLQKNM